MGNTAILGLGVLSLVALAFYIVYQTFFSPLSKAPASHWSARFSPVWLLWVRYKGTELSNLVQLHEKYGPIVQVGPRDISISSYQDGIRKVYDAGFGKPAPFYNLFNYFGRRNAFTSLDPREHGFRRRRTAALYSKTSLLGSLQMNNISIKVMFDRLVPRLSKASAKGVGIDALELSYCLCSDYISSFLFGYRSGTNFLSKDEQESINEWRLHYENHMCDEGFFPQEMPVFDSLLKNLGISLLPESYRGSKKFLEKWLADMAVKADETMLHHEAINQPIPHEDQPVVYGTAKSAVAKDSPHLDTKSQRDEVASEMFDHISASREVLGLVLAYTFWYLAQNPHAQRRVRDELNSAGIDMTKKPELASDPSNLSGSIPQALDKIKYLDAVIYESLRMRPTSTLLPRITPSDRSVSIAGVDNIPPNTRVNAFQWFVHRDPKKWDKVNDWIPERWLGRDESKKNGREDVLWAFASGPRVCLGSNWTFYAMKYIIATMCANFDFEALNRETGKCWPGSPADLLPVMVKPVSQV